VVEFLCRDIEALVEAARRGEEYKPFQVAKRSVFEQYGILGTVKDRVFTGILYRYFRAWGLANALWERGGLDVGEPRANTLLKLAAFLIHIERVPRDDPVLKSMERCLSELASSWGVSSDTLEKSWRRVLELDPQALGIDPVETRYLVPRYLLKILSTLVPQSELEQLLEALNKPPPLGLRVNTLKSSLRRVCRELRRFGVEFWISDRVPNVIRYRGPLRYSDFRPLQRGEVVPQDEPAALAAIILDPRPGEAVADLCAAPGGKTTHIAEITRNRATVVAADIYMDRIERLRELALRTGTYTSIEIVAMDSRLAPQILGEKRFDRVLLDPPCSSTGVLARYPDARWRLSPDKVLELVQLQRELLEAAHRVLRVGGYLLYTTCSLIPAENEGNIRWFLHKHPCYEIIPLRGPYDPSPLLPGTMRSWPHRHGVSGFFYALLKKVRDC